MAIELCIEAAIGLAGQSAHTVAANPILRRAQRPTAPAIDSHDDLRAALESALPTLTHAEAEVIWLVDVCRCSYAETAGTTDRSVASVARLVRSGRRRLLGDIQRNLA
ncbi:MAG: sigma factor-like helix-turn-helix DNA-binding protein [Actinomycetota bacterium]